MDYRKMRTAAVTIKVIGWLVLLGGLVWGAGDVGAGIYKEDNNQLGTGYQIIGIALGISIGILIIGGIWDRYADDMKHEEMMKRLEELQQPKPRRGRR